MPPKRRQQRPERGEIQRLRRQVETLKVSRCHEDTGRSYHVLEWPIEELEGEEEEPTDDFEHV